jgi:hypothetical protein
VLFSIGKTVVDKTLARIWVTIYLGTFVTFLYFKTGIIDPWFNLFIFLAIYHFYLLTQTTQQAWKKAVTVGVFLGLAVLTKGPVAILICLLTLLTMWLVQGRKKLASFSSLFTIAGSTFIVCFAWFGVDLVKNGPRFIIEFIERQIAIFSTSDAGHGQPFFYHWVVLLIGCFPASIFFIKGLGHRSTNPYQQLFKVWMTVLFWVTLLLFSIVKTKIVHYSSLCWFPLTYIAALAAYELIEKNKALHIGYKIGIAFLGLLLGLVILALPFLVMYKDAWVHLVDDDFAKANLQAQANFIWIDGIAGLLLVVGVAQFLIRKKYAKTIPTLFACVGACCFFTATLITPKIEAISQRANIEFFKQRQGEDCYVETFGYKSYAQHYYSKKMPFTNKNANDIEWLLHGKIDKPTYISVKVNSFVYMDSLPGFIKLYHKNGFGFYKRMPQ